MSEKNHVDTKTGLTRKQLVGVIRKKMDRVITKFESACAHRSHLDAACQAQDELIGFIDNLIKAKDEEIAALKNSKPEQVAP